VHIVEANHLSAPAPLTTRSYRLSLTDKVVDVLHLPDWAEEKARAVAREKGRDYYALRADWLAFAQAETAKGNPPKSAGAAFVAYCGKQNSLR
jgi:hypothetical protein